MSNKASATKVARSVLPSPALRQAILGSLPSGISAQGFVLLPAVPALVDHYVEGLCTTWATLGRQIGPDEREHFRQRLADKLEGAFRESPLSRVRVTYETDKATASTLTWRLAVEPTSMEDEYESWTKTRSGPLFGRHPDAKVMDLARSLGDGVPVLDGGAGTGRNSLPLARAGFATDVVELAPALATILRDELTREKLAVSVFEGNVLDATLGLPEARYRLLFLSEVVSHFRNVAELKSLFQTAERVLAPGGLLLFNVFVPVSGYKPDELARQMSEVKWCRIFTRHELGEAALASSLEPVSDEATLDYERAHQPSDQWPPTPWYEDWCTGRNVFNVPVGKSPIAARWLTYRKP